MTKNTLLVALLVLLSGLSFASDEVSIVVSSDGSTKDEAIKMALRSAIEQTFGAFVSSNTTVLNDQLVNDEIVSLSSGNVKAYEILSENTLPNNRYYITLRATICMNKLVNYINSNSQGTTVEVDLDAFDKNFRLAEMNSIAEMKIVESVIAQIESIENLFDYSLELEEPKVERANDTTFCVIRGEVVAKYNRNTDIAVDMLINMLKAVNMDKNEIELFEQLGLRYCSSNKSHFYSGGQIRSEYEPLINARLCLRICYDNSFLKCCTPENDLFHEKLYEFQIGDNVSFPSKLRIKYGQFSRGYWFSSAGKKYGNAQCLYYKDLKVTPSYRLKMKRYKIGDCVDRCPVAIVIPMNESQKYKSFHINSFPIKKD